MAKSSAVNYTTSGINFQKATAASDQFAKEDLQRLAEAVDQHQHDGLGKGLAVVATPISNVLPAIVLGTVAAIGAATTVLRSDATIIAFDATLPSTQAIGDAAVVGVIAYAARRDHKHAMPAFGVGAGSTQAFGDAAADGTATTIARADHKHAIMVAQTGGAAYTSGTATTTSATYVDLLSMSVTVTAALAASKLMVVFGVSVSTDTGSAVIGVGVKLDAAATVTLVQYPLLAALSQVMAGCYMFSAVGAGVHTIKLQWSTSAGTATATHRSLIVFEVLN